MNSIIFDSTAYLGWATRLAFEAWVCFVARPVYQNRLVHHNLAAALVRESANCRKSKNDVEILVDPGLLVLGLTVSIRLVG